MSFPQLQILYLSVAFSGPYDAVDIETFFVGLSHLLSFRFIKPTFYRFMGQIALFVRNWCCRETSCTSRPLRHFTFAVCKASMASNVRGIGPVSEVSFVKRVPLFSHTHSVTDFVLSFEVFRLQWIQSSSNCLFVVCVHFERGHSNRSMKRLIVRMQKVSQDVHVTTRILVGEIAKHCFLQRSMQSSTIAAFRSSFSLV